MEIPKTVIVDTGEHGKVQPTIDRFFVETREYLIQSYENIIHQNFHIESGELATATNHITDNRLTYMTYSGHLVAGVAETRTEFNHIQYTFFQSLDSLNDLGLREKKKDSNR